MRAGFLGLLVGSALMTSAHADTDWRYAISSIQVVDLGTMGGKESIANDINNQGEIVGWANLADGAKHAFLWRNGAMEDILPFRGVTSEARGINNLTRVVGYLQAAKDYGPHAFYWNSMGTVIQLDEAWTGAESGSPLCGSGANAKAINDEGVIAGIRLGGCNPPGAYIARAARWANWASPWQEIVPLGVAPKQNFAFNINTAGRIVGSDKDGYSWTGAFYWNGVANDVPFPLVTAPAFPEASSMKAFGINAGNDIVGSVKLRESPHPGESITRAYFWNGSSAQSSLLPALVSVGASVANEVNKEAFSVGYSDDRDRWAVVWHSHFGIKTLPMPPGAGSGTVFIGRQCEALAVNNRSVSGLVQAVGFCNVGGDRHAILWNIATYKSVIVGPTP